MTLQNPIGPILFQNYGDMRSKQTGRPNRNQRRKRLILHQLVQDEEAILSICVRNVHTQLLEITPAINYHPKVGLKSLGQLQFSRKL
jgi:hypothetical protein